eukprot:168336-Chlamydomonas_euryale.AAC.1
MVDDGSRSHMMQRFTPHTTIHTSHHSTEQSWLTACCAGSRVHRASRAGRLRRASERSRRGTRRGRSED